MTIEYESADDAAAARPDAAEVMRRVSEMVAARNAAEQRLVDAELKAKQAKAELFQIESVDIPELMRAGGLKRVTCMDGTDVRLTDEITCGISEDRREAAHAWLREKGLGGVIKTLVGVAFGKDELDKADELFLKLTAEFGPEAVSLDERVHPQTLKALLKEQMAEQKLDAAAQQLFAVVPFAIAKCKAPKARGAA